MGLPCHLDGLQDTAQRNPIEAEVLQLPPGVAFLEEGETERGVVRIACWRACGPDQGH